LAALHDKKPRTKAAQVRTLWPEIKAALEKGHSLKTVCECLEADGLTMTVQTLGSYVTRMRRMPALRDEPTVSRDHQHRMEAARDHDVAAVATAATSRSSVDPLANIRERLVKRTGFDYRPELADPKKLI
jgi:hypothetical protein